MNNGCICCTVRGDLIRTLHGLLSKQADNCRTFDAIIVETSGLADPGPVVQTFFVDQYLQERTVLDSVTTVVDALNIARQLAASREAVEQIAFADQIVLNKTELVGADQLREIETRLRKINPLAAIHRAQRANVSLDQVLGRGGFELARIESLEPDFLAHDKINAHGERGHVHDEHCNHDHHQHDHVHDSDIASVSLTSHTPMDGVRVSAWLTQLVAAEGQNILRAKGIIDVSGEARRMVFQAVHMLLEGDLQKAWRPDEVRVSRLVFIGRHLDRAALQAAFEACAAGKSIAASNTPAKSAPIQNQPALIP
jgi:G3E family GTPase